ncbi:MAG: glycosyltransferase [bacterium]|nr:glycosyltransferase [bacterium]
MNTQSLEPLSIGILIILSIALYYQVFLLLVFLGRKPSPLTQKLSSASLPSVTIVIPCYNEESTIANCIASVLALTYPQEKLNIVVVDDGSQDGSIEALRNSTHQERVLVIQKENGGKYTALNIAIPNITTDIVGTLDADSFVHPEALIRMVEKFADPRVMAVTPALKIHNTKGFFGRLQQTEYTLAIFIRNVLASLDAIHVTPGPFSLFRKEVFNKIGLYKKAHDAEDLEFALRMQLHHMKIANAHNAYVYTVSPATIVSLFRQRLRWTLGFLHNMIDYLPSLFRLKYGNLGMFVLPSSLLALGASVLMIWHLGRGVVSIVDQQLLKFSAVGASLPSLSLPSSELFFYINTSPMIFLVLTAMALTVALILIGKNLSGNEPLRMGILYFLFLYGFIALTWYLSAAVRTLFMRKTIHWK